MPDLPDFDELWDYNDPTESERRFRAILPRARSDADSAYLAELLTQIARTEGLQGRFEEAHRTLDEVEGLLPQAGTRPRVRFLLERGRVLNSSGRPDESGPLFLQAWDLARDAGEDYHAVDAAHMMGIVEPADRQLEWSVKAMDMAERSADPKARGWLGSLYNNTGWTYHDLGRYEEALDQFKKSLAWREQEGKPRETRIARWSVGRALRSLGRYSEALELQQENLQRLRESGDHDGFVQEEIGECLMALDRAAEARPHFERAYEALSGDEWIAKNEAARLERLRVLARMA